jgi:hypothetical protein
MRYIWDASPAALTPSFFFSSMKVAEYLPLGWFQDLVKSREVLREQTIACVAQKHPRPCEGLDICTRASGVYRPGSIFHPMVFFSLLFSVAGSTVTLLFPHILAELYILNSLCFELDTKFRPSPILRAMNSPGSKPSHRSPFRLAANLQALN